MNLKIHVKSVSQVTAVYIFPPKTCKDSRYFQMIHNNAQKLNNESVTASIVDNSF